MFLLALAESGSVQLVPDGTLFIHIALILLMIYILNRTFFRPINRVIAEREKNKAGGGEAASLLQEVSEKETKYSEAIREARSRGYGLIEQERTQALDQKQIRVGTAKEEAERTLSTEMSDLERQTVEARASIAAEADRMAEKISANILKA